MTTVVEIIATPAPYQPEPSMLKIGEENCLLMEQTLVELLMFADDLYDEAPEKYPHPHWYIYALKLLGYVGMHNEVRAHMEVDNPDGLEAMLDEINETLGDTEDVPFDYVIRPVTLSENPATTLSERLAKQFEEDWLRESEDIHLDIDESQ